MALGIIRHTTHVLKIAKVRPAGSRTGIFAKKGVNFGKVRIKISTTIKLTIIIFTPTDRRVYFFYFLKPKQTTTAAPTTATPSTAAPTTAAPTNSDQGK